MPPVYYSVEEIEMVIEGAVGPILIAIFVVLVVIFVYLAALPTLLEQRGIDIKKLQAKTGKRK